jgi:hypothetical protein
MLPPPRGMYSAEDDTSQRKRFPVHLKSRKAEADSYHAQSLSSNQAEPSLTRRQFILNEDELAVGSHPVSCQNVDRAKHHPDMPARS